MNAKRNYNEALENYRTARANAWKAVEETKHYVAIAEDGYPNWEACYFGETAEAYFFAKAELAKASKAYEAEKKAEAEKRKAERKAFEANNPEIVAERKRKASLKRYATEKAKLEKEIAEKVKLLRYYESKIKELEAE